MKIYVSEKEKDFIDACLSETKCYEFVSEELQYEDSLRLISLEQHNKELLSEIVSLKRYISHLEYWKSYWYNSYDEIRNKYNKNQQVKQERIKAIAELEEFVKKLFSVEDFIEKLYVNSVPHKNGVPRDNTPYTRNKIKNIKKRLIEKLKEMKGV